MTEREEKTFGNIQECDSQEHNLPACQQTSPNSNTQKQTDCIFTDREKYLNVPDILSFRRTEGDNRSLSGV